MPTGVYERSEHRFCKKGHDKFLPHGTYVWKDSRGGYYQPCAVCARAKADRNRAKMIQLYGRTRKPK